MALNFHSSQTSPAEILYGKRILIADDHGIVVFCVQKVFQKIGMIVVGTTHTAPSIVRMAHAERPDIVLMGIGRIGGMDGITDAIHLLAPSHCCVVLCSGYLREVLEPAISRGACRVISKPYTHAGLRDNLSQAYEQWGGSDRSSPRCAA